jgi:hypothetical protein
MSRPVPRHLLDNFGFSGQDRMMIFHPNNGCVEVYVESRGFRIKEYRDANENDQSMRPVRYIKAISGAPYRICVKIPSTLNHSTKARFMIDGVPVTSKIMLKEERHFSCYRDSCVSRHNGQDVFQALRFSQLGTGKYCIRCSAFC